MEPHTLTGMETAIRVRPHTADSSSNSRDCIAAVDVCRSAPSGRNEIGVDTKITL